MRITAKVFWIVGLVLPALAMMTALVWAEEAGEPGTISGIVQNADGPLPGAHVRIQLSEDMVVTDDAGMFELAIPDAAAAVTLTAWSPGHYIGVAYAASAGDSVVIEMKPHYVSDNVEYGWFEFDGVEGSEACGLCHLGMDEWQKDAHGQAAGNARFLSIYLGSDVEGHKGPKTQMDYKGNVLPRDPDEAYYGPGFKLDYPNRSGNCAACHTPMAAKLDNTSNCGWSGCHTSTTAQNAPEVPDGVSPLYLSGDASEGISCEFCHKIADVILDEETQLPLPDMPGIMSHKLMRPVEGEELFFGTFEDIPRRDTYLPLQKESAFCAGCHYGVFGGVVGMGEVTGGTLIYNSYGEWLESPYNDPDTGQTCQDCHMPVTDEEYFVFPERGGLPRPGKLHTHLMPGASDEEFLQNSASMTVTATIANGQLVVDVAVMNDKTGHHLPTGAPMREVLLVVNAYDSEGEPLALSQGDSLPEWAGNYAGAAGRIFEKLLRDEWTGEMPTGAYWRPVTIVSDTRLPAMATDESQYVFGLEEADAASIDARLIFRRTFQELSEQKGWDDPDILMEQAEIEIDADATPVIVTSN